MPDRPAWHRARAIARWTLAIAYAAAGVLHLLMPAPFLLITPDWVPFPRLVILATGICEIAGAIGLLTRRWRRAAGIALALYALCVFPANIKHAMSAMGETPVPPGWWYHGPRLALQPVLVWWALFAAGVLTWPVSARINPDR